MCASGRARRGLQSSRISALAPFPMYADGAFEIEEQSFLNVLCNAFEISENEFVLIKNWVRRLIALEREANAFF